MRKGIRPAKHGAKWLFFTLACFALAAFFKFALIGYGFTSLFFAFVGIIIALYYFLRNAKKARCALTALLCAGCAAFILIEIPIVNASKCRDTASSDYLIVLGAGVNGSVPSLSLVNRLDAAIDYLSLNPHCIAIVSGGQGEGEDITEAQAMHDYLTSHGIAESRVVQEGKATSTLENLQFSFEKIRELGDDPEKTSVAIVSSEYHLYRAEYMARSLGVEASGVAARTTLPILRMNYFVREAFAVVYLWVFGV